MATFFDPKLLAFLERPQTGTGTATLPFTVNLPLPVSIEEQVREYIHKHLVQIVQEEVDAALKAYIEDFNK